MLSLFIVVGCAAKILNKRLERRKAEYVDTNRSKQLEILLPLLSTPKEQCNTSTTTTKEYAVEYSSK